MGRGGNTIRVCELKTGDIFLFLGWEYIVHQITDKHVLYCREFNGTGEKNKFGKKSQQKVEIVEYAKSLPERETA